MITMKALRHRRNHCQAIKHFLYQAQRIGRQKVKISIELIAQGPSFGDAQLVARQLELAYD
jgi:hypothetical protein